MSEKIYTIPVNEAFEACAEDKSRGCPFCRLYNKLEADETDLILGASMMEPDVRIKTNEKGFCATHFQMLLSGKNRLGLGLMLESHTEQLKKELENLREGSQGLKQAVISATGSNIPSAGCFRTRCFSGRRTRRSGRR
ncbi:MAG: hypothetical protein BHW37_01510 [Firmicutes bacterium CAG:272_52_7]|nr:MAG: hypothetical protein BHW37_01510 [Firmicutes bacterium CAG:272_52_7]